jgi:5'-deoxy-5'-methylthioadenosine phosphorylase
MTTRTGAGALGVIAGTGFYSLEILDDPEDIVLESTYGSVCAVTGRLHGRQTFFVSRHGADHSVPPHLVNFRAMIDGLAAAGVTQVLAVNVVGGIGHDAGELVVVDDFLDFTKQRTLTFFDGSTPEGVVHVDVGEPYSPHVRRAWLDAAQELGVVVVPEGIYAATEGPRFETRAEIRMMASAGATVVGMTGVPEVVLAKERNIDYASLCLVANPAAGQSEREITIDEVMAVVADGAHTVGQVMNVAARILATSEDVSP